MFKRVDPKQSFPKLEEEIIKFWKENKIFEMSVSERTEDRAYVFYDGPPFATGLPHYGHILAGTMKDVVPRYWTMRGHRVERRFGWDCHGLPVENLVEGELGVKGRNEIEEKVGVPKFNEACRASVLRYTAEWEKTVERMGRWVDFKNDYKTMDVDYMESIWWVFKQLWDKGLIYEGHKPMHICPSCVTPLSNFEVSLGYADVTDLSAIVKFKLADDALKILGCEGQEVFVLAWTTTPWTLPGNVALAFGKDVEYVLVKRRDDNGSEQSFIAAKSLLGSIFGEENLPEIVKTIDVKALEGSHYEPLFPYFQNLEGKKYTVEFGDFVTTEEGTGIVHIAPMFGEDDFNLGQAKDLAKIQHVNMDGTFTDEVTDFAGKEVKGQDQNIAKYLEGKGLLFSQHKYKHSYPHCWRCDAPLLNYATSSWFVRVEDLKEKMLAANEQIHWVPEHLKHGRFGKWLENARDWCISRNRFWGAPLPIWVSEDGKDHLCVGSREELKELSGVLVDDLHKHFVDEVSFEKDGKTYRRTPEVLDCWFESGAMPYAQNHYPFENKEWFEKNFPAQFIAEGLDQTRGWFYTLVVLGAALFDKPPFKNVIVNGLVLAEDGKKMSKRLKNYPDPAKIFDDYGADALRFYMMNSPVVKAETLRFSERGVEDVVRNIMLPLWNAYSFFVTYAEIDGWSVERYVEGRGNRLDRWIVSELEQLLNELTKELDNYDLQRATEPIVKFINSLTNWYIRRSRRRFWKSENDGDKDEAYSTLFYVLKRLSLVLAPFMPFISEEIYRNLTPQTGQAGETSVHLADWPEFDAAKIDLVLNREIELVQQIVSLGLAIRAQHKLKVRQPLSRIEVVGARFLEKIDQTVCGNGGAHCVSPEDVLMIEEELNVKEVVFLADSQEVASKMAKPIGAKIGPKFGKDVQTIISAAKNGEFEEIFEDGKFSGNIKVAGTWVLEAGEYDFAYEGKEGHFVAAEGGVVVSLDGEVTPELKREGIARDVVRFVQNLRKEADYRVDDRISVGLAAAEEVTTAVNEFAGYICDETLASEFGVMRLDEFEAGAWDKAGEVDVDGQKVLIGVKRI